MGWCEEDAVRGARVLWGCDRGEARLGSVRCGVVRGARYGAGAVGVWRGKVRG